MVELVDRQVASVPVGKEAAATCHHGSSFQLYEGFDIVDHPPCDDGGVEIEILRKSCY